MGEECPNPAPCCFDGSFGGLAQQRFQLGEHLLDRIQIGTVRRQEEQLCAGRADRPPNGDALVAAEIVDDDDVTRLQGRNEELLDIGKEAAAVDRAVDHARCVDPIDAQRSKEGQGLPMTVRHFGDQPLTARRAPIGARHVGLGPGLIDEDEASGVQAALQALPSCPSSCHVRAILFAGVKALFFS